MISALAYVVSGLAVTLRSDSDSNNECCVRAISIIPS